MALLDPVLDLDAEAGGDDGLDKRALIAVLRAQAAIIEGLAAVVEGGASKVMGPGDWQRLALDVTDAVQSDTDSSVR